MSSGQKGLKKFLGGKGLTDNDVSDEAMAIFLMNRYSNDKLS